MPFICLRRTDVPAGVLQALTLKPNKSRQNLVYDPPAQTKYVSYRPDNDTVATTGAGPITTNAAYSGIAAYLIDHAQAGGLTGGEAALTAANANTVAAALVARLDGGLSLTLTVVNAALAAEVANTDLSPGTAASGTITVDVNANIDAGEAVTIGGLDLDAVVGAAGVDEYTIGGDEAASAANIATAINLATNSFTTIVTASALGAVVTVTAVVPGAAGDAITLAVDDATSHSVSGATLAGSTGSGSTGDLDALLRIIAGELYTVPAGSEIENASNQMVQTDQGAFGTNDRILRTYQTGAFELSRTQGELSVLKGATFSYLGTTGAAVTIYDDSGNVL